MVPCTNLYVLAMAGRSVRNAWHGLTETFSGQTGNNTGRWCWNLVKIRSQRWILLTCCAYSLICIFYSEVPEHRGGYDTAVSGEWADRCLVIHRQWYIQEGLCFRRSKVYDDMKAVLARMNSIRKRKWWGCPTRPACNARFRHVSRTVKCYSVVKVRRFSMQKNIGGDYPPMTIISLMLFCFIAECNAIMREDNLSMTVRAKL